MDVANMNHDYGYNESKLFLGGLSWDTTEGKCFCLDQYLPLLCNWIGDLLCQSIWTELLTVKSVMHITAHFYHYY